MSQQLVTSRIENVCDLSPLQEGMLFRALADPDGGAYVVQQVYRAGDGDGPFDVDAVGVALRAVAVKHAILRTAFVSEGLDRPRQVVLRDRRIGFTVVDLRRAGPAETAGAMERLLAEDVRRGFDLAHDPLLRVTAVRAVEDGFEVLRLVWTYHHIILDGWSLSALFGDFLRYHRAAAAGTEPSAVVATAESERGDAPDYAAYVRRLADRSDAEFERYWTGLLAGHDGTPAVSAATAALPEAEGAGRFVSVTRTGLARRLADAFSVHGVTLAHVAEAAWGVVLSRAAGVADVVFGKVVSGRDVPLPGVERTVGLFINTIPVRVRVDPAASVGDLVAGVRDQAVASTGHDHGSLARIQALAGVEGLVSTLFAFENFEVDEEVVEGAGLTFERSREETDHPLTMTVQRTGDELTFVVLYDRAVLTGEDAERFAGRLTAVLEGFAGGGERVGGVSSLLPGERDLVVHGFNDTVVPYPRDGWIGGVFAEVAAAHPDRVALVCGDDRLTYAELADRATRVAAVLTAAGVGVGDMVGLAGETGANLFTGLLGIVLSGAAYIPVDIDAPAARGAAAAEDAAVSVIVAAGPRGTDHARAIAPGARVVDVDAALAGGTPAVSGGGDPTAAPAPAPSGGDAAYVMFTSGTTGRPKGSVIPHRAVLRLVRGNTSLPLTPDDVLVQTGSLAFDAATFEIWGMWLNGGTLVVPGHHTLLDPQRLAHVIRAHHATVMWLTVTLFNQITTTDPHTFTGLKRLVIGGEAVSAHHVQRLYHTDPHIQVINGYGPTENTTFTTTHPIPRTPGRTIPIGTPITGTNVHVLHGDRVCGIGETGELCAAGDGLSTGYLGLPGLTAEKFTPDPTRTGRAPAIDPIGGTDTGRVYHTGDRARWLADGTLEYLGRLDHHQAKIRGHRIELSDIDTTVRAHPGIRDAITIARRDADGASLTTYIVADADGVTPTLIREFLTHRLPGYMIPTHIIDIPAIPTTPNGKLDQRALPTPEHTAHAHDTTTPATPTEAAVCTAFAEVLGLDHVGVLDSFFELGGDSIKAIRVVSLVRQAGYELSVGAVMAGATPRAVAARVEHKTESVYEQGEVTGPVAGRWPIAERFFAWDLAVPEHFNQDVLIDLGYTEPEHVRTALDAVWEHHDALRGTVRNATVVIGGARESAYGFEHHHVGDPAEVETVTAEVADRLHTAMDLEKGPLLQAALFTAPTGSRLFLAAHHLVVDAVSWQIVTDDLLTGIRAARTRRPIALPAKTASLHQWTSALRDLAAALAEEERGYWDRVDRDAATAGLAVPGPGPAGGAAAREVVLDPDATAALGRAAAAYHASMEDAVLAGLTMGVTALTGQHRIAVLLERHGRSGHPDLPAVDRTVGWFTTIHPAVLPCHHDAAEALVGTKEALRAVPHDGIGHGLRPDATTTAGAPITVNYLGRQDSGDMTAFGDVVFGRTGIPSAPTNRHAHGVTVNAVIRDGRLVATLADTGTLTGEELDRFAAHYLRGLTALAERAGDQRRKTPSDYSVTVPLTRDDLGRIAARYPGHEDIADLTPLQEGMLFHGLEDADGGAYVVQQVFRAGDEDGPFDADAVAIAVRALAVRHDALRTAFTADGLERPRQVILGDRTITYAVADITDPEPEAAVDRLLAEDVRRGFDLARDPLLRVTAIRTVEDGRDVLRLVWTYHHIILDGWSLSALFGDFLRYHRAAAAGRETTAVLADAARDRAEAPSFTAYVRHLAGRGTAASEEYWADLLDGYDTDARLTTAAAEGTGGASGVGRAAVSSSGGLARRLAGRFAPRGATLSHVTEAAWGVVLSRACGTSDVVFGKVVSGRDTTPPGMDATVGLFINTIPVRFRTDPDRSVGALVDAVRDQAIASAAHDHTSLTRMRAPVPAERLVSTLFAFENYHVEAGTVHGGGLTYERGREEETNYPFNLVVQQDGDELAFSALYDRAVLTDADAERLLTRVLSVLDGFAADTGAPVAEVPTVSPAEKRTLVEECNATAVPYPEDMTAVSAFLDGVREHPDRVALVWGDRTMTYRETADAAAGVARGLIAGGTPRGAAVGVLGERGPHVIVGVLGAMLAGCHFIPLDIASPPARTGRIVADSGMTALVTYGPRAAETTTALADVLAAVTVHDLATMTAGSTWDDGAFGDRLPAPEDVAYRIYTSGTTGVPKGVTLRHRGVANLRTHLRNSYGVTAADRVLQFANLTFDASVWEIALSLLNGAGLVIVDQDTVHDPALLSARARRSGVTLGLLPPQYYLLCEGLPFRTVTTGGGASSHAVVDKARREGARYVNAYGPTETTVLATQWHDDGRPLAGRARIPIGVPVANTRVHVADGDRLCGTGEIGELCAAGDGLADGYLGLPELTAEKFVPDPHGPGNLYRTGDRVRRLDDGTIEYLGRVDDAQIKIRGHRVETGEVEAALRAHPEVRDATVIAHERHDGSAALAAYVVPAAGDVDAAGLRAFLTERLPGYMVPAHLTAIAAIPLNRSGKVDHAALPAPVPADAGRRAEAADEVEAAIAAIWADVLGHARVGATENFFELGGDSLTIVRVHGRLGKEFGETLTVGDLFAMPTVRSLAAGIRARRSERITLTRTALKPHGPANATRRPAAVTYPHPWADGLAAEAAYALVLALEAACAVPPSGLLVRHGGGLVVVPVPPAGGHAERLRRLRRTLPEATPLTGERRVRVDGDGVLPLLRLPGAARVSHPVLRDVDVTVELAAAGDRVTARAAVDGHRAGETAAAQLFQRFAVLFGRLASAGEDGGTRD